MQSENFSIQVLSAELDGWHITFTKVACTCLNYKMLSQSAFISLPTHSWEATQQSVTHEYV